MKVIHIPEPFFFRLGLGEMQKIKILAIPGSLRKDSSSYALLKVISEMMPQNISFEIYQGIGTLPHFNDAENPDENVIDFKRKIAEAQGVLICTPEYAFGVPGSLKNALDWTVSSGEFVDKPVSLITASSQGERCHEAMQYILTAISAKLNPATTLLISFIRAKIKDGKIVDSDTEKLVSSLVQNFVKGLN